jgi:hypothetical protein
MDFHGATQARAQLTQVQPGARLDGLRARPSLPCTALSSSRLDTRPAPSMESRQRRGDVEILNYLRDQAGIRSLIFDLSITHHYIGSSSHVQQKGLLTHPQDLDAPLRLAAQRKINNYRQQYADNQKISLLPAIVSTCTRMHGKFLRLLFLQAHRETFSTGPPGIRGALHCHWNAIATKQQGHVRFSPRGLLSELEEPSRTCGSQSGGGEYQPQYSGLWHSRIPSARSLSHSPSSPPPSFTLSPFPPRSLVRDGQTRPLKPRLVVSHSTCPPLSPN